MLAPPLAGRSVVQSVVKERHGVAEHVVWMRPVVRALRGGWARSSLKVDDEKDGEQPQQQRDVPIHEHHALIWRSKKVVSCTNHLSVVFFFYTNIPLYSFTT
jgi:hypothetical protein